mmetsp:Transcript_21577/g.35934  ORF Transcript_21577/g.35934 Transcript_21577/m.35934 type:complete len:425 (+) Transcript_21577:667-1941(+)
MVVLQIRVHGLDLLFHLCNLVILRIDLCLQFSDLVVQHKFELLELLILFLQLIDLPFLVADGAIPLPDLFGIVIPLLVQLGDLLLFFPFLFFVSHQLIIFLLHLLIQLLAVALVDAGLTSQANLVVALRLQTRLLIFLQLLNLPIRVQLQLSHGFSVDALSQGLLVQDPINRLHVGFLSGGKLRLHLVDFLLMFCNDPLMLLPPAPVNLVALSGQFLILVHLLHHLFLEALLQVLVLLGVMLQQALDVLLRLHLSVVLLFSEHFVLLALLINLRRVLLIHCHHLFFVEAISMPELEFLLVGQLIHLSLELVELSLLIIQEGPRDQDLIRQRQGAFLVTLRDVAIFPLHVEDKERSILRCGEEVEVVRADSQPRGRCRVGREVRPLAAVVAAIQRELVAANSPGSVWLCNCGEEALARIRQDDLP